MSYNILINLEKKLGEFTGAPYVVLTDCCTHAIELCLRFLGTTKVRSSCYTYLSVPMVYKKLRIDFDLIDEKWVGEYRLHNTPIWDSARLLSPNMYREGQYQCLSFGNGKPVDNKRGGAILLDNKEHYHLLKRMAYDGRDLSISPWIQQQTFTIGYHYNMPFEHAGQIICKMDDYIRANNFQPEKISYPDCREINFVE